MGSRDKGKGKIGETSSSTKGKEVVVDETLDIPPIQVVYPSE